MKWTRHILWALPRDAATLRCNHRSEIEKHSLCIDPHRTGGTRLRQLSSRSDCDCDFDFDPFLTGSVSQTRYSILLHTPVPKLVLLLPFPLRFAYQKGNANDDERWFSPLEIVRSRPASTIVKKSRKEYCTRSASGDSIRGTATQGPPRANRARPAHRFLTLSNNAAGRLNPLIDPFERSIQRETVDGWTRGSHLCTAAYHSGTNDRKQEAELARSCHASLAPLPGAVHSLAHPLRIPPRRLSNQARSASNQTFPTSTDVLGTLSPETFPVDRLQIPRRQTSTLVSSTSSSPQLVASAPAARSRSSMRLARAPAALVPTSSAHWGCFTKCNRARSSTYTWFNKE